MILKFIKNLITARSRSGPGENRQARTTRPWYYVGQLLNPETLKRLGIIAAVVAVIVSLIKRWRQISAYRAAVSAEIKKQLEPVWKSSRSFRSRTTS